MRKSFHLLENITANFFIKAITYIFSFLNVLFATRALLPEAYGQASFVSSCIGYFLMFSSLGMANYATRACAERRGNRDELSRISSELWSIGIVFFIFSSLLLFLSVLVIPRFFSEWTLFFIYSSELILQAFGFEWLYRGLEQFKFLAISQLICKSISLLCIVLFVHSPGQLTLYAIFSVLSSQGGSIICFLQAKKHVDLSFQWNPDHLKPLCIFFLMSCAVSIYSSLDLTMLGFMKTDMETGLYSVAAKGKNVLTIIGGVVWTSILPHSTKLWKEGKRQRFKSLADRTVVVVAGIQLVVTVICFIFAKEIVLLVGGESYTGAVGAFRILLLSIVPIGISNILGGQILIPAGLEKCLLKAEITGAVMNFLANLFIIPLYSIEGAAATTVLSEIIVTIICFFYTRTRLDMNFDVGLVRKVAKGSVRILEHASIKLRSKANAIYYCPCCDNRIWKYVEGRYRQRPQRYNPTRYEGIEHNVICPFCGSFPRHRIFAMWMKENVGQFRDILYFAQEKSMRIWMEREEVECITADLNTDADLKLNIQATGLPDGSYDLIICNHVLEHVDDFRLALKEMYRILRIGGSFICSFPMDPKIELVDEDPVNSPEERFLRFGQTDHKRVFGMKADQLLSDAGFTVEVINGIDYPEEILPVIGPADYDMNILFRCIK